ncbi:MAG TPA: fatty acyl-AMP ligase [Pyrinomonadaceae bacterium]
MRTQPDGGFESAYESATLIDLLRRRAYARPSQRVYTFLASGEEEEAFLTYGELDQRARALGAVIQGVSSPGDRALLLYPPGLDFIVAFMGCLYAGVIAVPAYPPRLNRNLLRLQAIVGDAGATLSLTTEPILSKIEPMLEEFPGLKGVRWMTTDDVPDAASAWREPGARGDTLAFLQYTSGSTGTPKGVMVSHANLLHNQRHIQAAFGLKEHAVAVNWLPLYHDMGLIGNVLHPLYMGMHCVVMSPLHFLQRPVRWLQAITRYRAMGSGGPNFAYDLCVRKVKPEQLATLDLSSWEVAYSGAEPIRRETLDRFAETFAPCGFRREFFLPGYGLAEATLLVSSGRKGIAPVVASARADSLEANRFVESSSSDDARPLVSCGGPLLDQRVGIVNTETLEECAPGEVGEVWVSGGSVAQGYWNNPVETARTFQAYVAGTGEGPFLRTGDLGFMHGGELYITGRLKDLIIIDGRNHYPQDIELTVEQCHDAVKPNGCAAFAVEADEREQLVVMAEVKRGAEQGEVLKAVRRAVAEYHELQVRDIVLLTTESLPRTSSGKIQRHACLAHYLARETQVEDVGEDSSPVPHGAWTSPEVVAEGQGQPVS